ncbi:MAG: homoserine kinase [Streptosporangiaceae bacterium]
MNNEPAGNTAGAAASGGLTWPDGPVTVRVPATSANLGPGFDSCGLALSLHDTVQAQVLPAGLEVQVSGVGAGELDRGERHLVVRAMRAAFAAIGARPPGLSVSCRNEVPQGYGLGSSAAAIVAGLVAARALAADVGEAGTLPDQALFELASELEGHPDNVAACLYGGLTVAWSTDTGVRAARLAPLAGLAPVLCVPAEPLPTVTARQALPTRISHASGAANSARAALLIAALTGRPDLLLAGTEDFLHQPYRAASMPASAALIARLRAAGLAAAVSGAGPAVLVLTMAGQRPGAAEVAQLAAEVGSAWQVLPLTVDSSGATVLPGRSAG